MNCNVIFCVIYGNKEAFDAKLEDEEEGDLLKLISLNKYKYSFAHDSSDNDGKNKFVEVISHFT